MNNNGWVQLRRGILDHLLDGRLTATECFSLVLLIVLADGSTGGGIINAPLLCYWMGHLFNQNTAARVLSELHRKRYIWYRASRSKAGQKYFINRYFLTKGRMIGRMTNLFELFDQEDASVDDVLRHAGDRANHDEPLCVDHDRDHGADHHADNNNTETETEKKKEKDRKPAPARKRDSAVKIGERGGEGEGRDRTGVDLIHSSPVQQEMTTTKATSDTTASSSSPAAAKCMASDYLQRLSTRERLSGAAQTTWPPIFDRLVARYGEADLNAAIEWAWTESDFWCDKMDRQKGDPAEYLDQHAQKIIEQWRRETRPHSAINKNPEHEPDHTLGGLLNIH